MCFLYVLSVHSSVGSRINVLCTIFISRIMRGGALSAQTNTAETLATLSAVDEELVMFLILSFYTQKNAEISVGEGLFRFSGPL